MTDLHLLMTAPFDEPTCCFYAACLSLALSHLHGEGVIYRNLSPEAIMIDARGMPQLVEFRQAVRFEGVPLHDICGIEQYLAPEQVAPPTWPRLRGPA